MPSKTTLSTIARPPRSRNFTLIATPDYTCPSIDQAIRDLDHLVQNHRMSLEELRRDNIALRAAVDTADNSRQNALASLEAAQEKITDLEGKLHKAETEVSDLKDELETYKQYEEERKNA